MSTINADTTNKVSEQSYIDFNARLNLWGADNQIQFESDKEAARQYFLQHVNPKTRWFHDIEERFRFLLDNDYYEQELIDLYDFQFIKSLTKKIYEHRFRFESFMGAYKFYEQYALKTLDGSQYLERFEDRVVMTALGLARGSKNRATEYAEEIISQRFQPATPTFINMGKKRRGEYVSCFLLGAYDNMESITQVVSASLQLSKRGGGVGILLSNLRELGAPIKGIEGAASGVVPVMKILEDSFSYANQLGARQGAGAVYLNVHHPDIMRFLDTKRENADEKIRIKTLSLGVVIPDITFELAKSNEDMYLFSPHDVEKEYGKPFSEINVSEEYYSLVNNPKITKTKISARKLFTTIAGIQFESGYPYIMFEDTVNRAHNIDGKVQFSNLCVAPETKILTDQGQQTISELEGETVRVWNGKQFSETEVVKTGINQKLVTVTLNNGETLDVTEYHKFYVQRGYSKGTGVNKLKIEVLRTHELKAGDKLIKFDLPVLEDSKIDFEDPYTAGFFTAEGTYGGIKKDKPKIYLYGDKKYLLPWLNVRSGSGKPDASNRLSYELFPELAAKFTVPSNQYSIKSRLDWLAGLIDGDGTSTGISAQGIQISSINKEFLLELRLMLQTLGIHSRLNLSRAAGKVRMRPTEKEYDTKDVFRLLISGSETQNLITLGLVTHRVKLAGKKVNREAKQMVRVVSVEDHGRYSDTYCVNEPLEHKAVFNGVLTGNCSEILQITTETQYNDDGTPKLVGRDISCNLGSLNIAKVMDGGSILNSVRSAVRALTSVSDQSNISVVPTVKNGNEKSHAIGLGQMNLHGFLAREGIEYGSEEALDFVSSYFAAVAYYAVHTSMLISKEQKTKFDGFDKSKYASGEYFDKYTSKSWLPQTKKISQLFSKFGVDLPTTEDWAELQKLVSKYGMYNAYLQAVAPTGSISYVNNSTSSIHPITSMIEIRKEGKLGRVYYPAPYLTNENKHLYADAYEIGYEKLIDTYAAATEHVDQGLSLTLFFKDTHTTRDLNKAYIYAWSKGIKTIYYSRIRQAALDGTEMEMCVSCTI